MLPLSSLSLVLPAYNEEGAIQSVLSQAVLYLRQHVRKFEIIVVNDGSSDRTAALVCQVQTNFSEIKLIEHAQNRGYGEALRTGFNAARYDWILLMDSDGQFDIHSLSEFSRYTSSADLIIGRRLHRQDPLIRIWMTRGYNLLVMLLFGLPYDFGCAFKLFRRSSWQRIQPIHARDHKVFSVEWLLKSHQAGLQIHELPVKHLPRITGQPTGMRLDVIRAMVVELIRLRLS